MSQNKLLTAYSHILKTAKAVVLKTELKSWDLLSQAVHNAEEQHAKLVELSKQQIEQVKQDLDQDLVKIAEYLNDVEIGIEEFINIDLAVLEDILQKKCNQLADPTEVTILRIRMLAAMEPEKSVKPKHY